MAEEFFDLSKLSLEEISNMCSEMAIGSSDPKMLDALVEWCLVSKYRIQGVGDVLRTVIDNPATSMATYEKIERLASPGVRAYLQNKNWNPKYYVWVKCFAGYDLLQDTEAQKIIQIYRMTPEITSEDFATLLIYDEERQAFVPDRNPPEEPLELLFKCRDEVVAVGFAREMATLGNQVQVSIEYFRSPTDHISVAIEDVK
jgi:hypothetical protein